MSQVLTHQLMDMQLFDIRFKYDVHANASINAKYGHEYVISCLEYAKT